MAWDFPILIPFSERSHCNTGSALRRWQCDVRQYDLRQESQPELNEVIFVWHILSKKSSRMIRAWTYNPVSPNQRDLKDVHACGRIWTVGQTDTYIHASIHASMRPYVRPSVHPYLPTCTHIHTYKHTKFLGTFMINVSTVTKTGYTAYL